MNKKRFAILTLAVIVLQSTIFSKIVVFSAVPNIYIIYTICLAMLYGSKWASYTGLGLGLMEDVMFSYVLGVKSLIYFLIGHISGELIKNGGTRILSGGLSVFVATFAARIVALAIKIIIRWGLVDFSYFMGPVFVEGLMNMGLYFIFILLIKKIIPPYPIRKFTGI